MHNSSTLLPLKIVVITLGIVLIGGIIFMCITVSHKLSKELGSPHCAKDASLQLQLKGKSNIANITPEGDTVQIAVATDGKVEVLTVDRCTGTLLQTLTIVP